MQVAVGTIPFRGSVDRRPVWMTRDYLYASITACLTDQIAFGFASNDLLHRANTWSVFLQEEGEFRSL
jgi:hypothetical protein